MRKCRGMVFLMIAVWSCCLISGCDLRGGNHAAVKDSHSVEEENIVSKADTGHQKDNSTELIPSSEPKTVTKSEKNPSSKSKTVRESEKTSSTESSSAEPEITEVIEEILSKATKDLVGSYRIDESFLMWLAGQYDRESVYALQQTVKKGSAQMESWYEITGKSIHVLWVEYCRDTGMQEYYLEKVYEKKCSDDSQVIMDFTGDINLAEGWSSTRYLDGQSGGIRDCFSASLWQEMQSVDILMINNEFAFSNRGEALAGKAYTFRADPRRVSVISEIGTDILSLANNHVYDYGEEALLDTLDTIEGAKIPYVGAGRNLEEAMKPVYFIANGRKIAIVSASQIERSTNYTKEATDETAGVLKTLNPDKFLTVIEEAESRSDYVIAFVHWGTENTNHYEGDQVELGHKFIDAGADVIIGGHTHCLQGFDYYNGKPIIYSLGNYWFNDRTIDTGLSQVIIHTDSNAIDFRFLPCIQRGCVTSLVEDEGEKQRILDFMQRISASNVSVGEDGNVTEIP